jgi:hypothetical protein
VWNWQGGGYLPGAELAWKQGEGFYVYEAALPWKSLGLATAQPGAEMGLELGRGCCGSGFQDLSGADPDSAANLVKLTLVERLSPGAGQAAAPPAGADAVALQWELDGGGARKHAQAGSPDRDYLWLERLASLPIDLAAGQHSLSLEYAGADPQRAAAIDGFLLLPAVLTRSFSGPDGSLVLTYDINLGRLSIEEHHP